MIIDVTVIDYVYTGDPDALQLASVEKHGHYDALAEALKMDFFAVPLSSYGKLHSESHRFIGKRINPPELNPPDEIPPEDLLNPPEGFRLMPEALLARKKIKLEIFFSVTIFGQPS